MRTRVFLLAMVALAVTSPAAAKGPIALEICGASECRDFRWTPASRTHEALVTGLAR
jgi:hypothetical protein